MDVRRADRVVLIEQPGKQYSFPGSIEMRHLDQLASCARLARTDLDWI
ncbi:MAG: hypothetical protein ACJ8AG_24925 [Ktedonobacteraceae bacterium]